MVVLWTDALIYILIFVLLGLVFYLRDKEHIKCPLQKITRSKVGMASLVVLLFFVLIGLLDSVHFKPASSLDVTQWVRG
jgi:peptide/nickel transport system permease protein